MFLVYLLFLKSAIEKIFTDKWIRAEAVIIIFLLSLGGLFVLRENFSSEVIERPTETPIEPLPIEPLVEASKEPPVEDPRNVLLNVPFTSQAPFGDWDNVIFQQGCEEASMLMAMLWVQGKQITASAAEKAIRAISNFEQKNYGEFRDTSAHDTAEIMKDYFDYKNVEARYGIGIYDIKRELARGNLVIVPVNGQRIGNPFYTPPGPLQHMLVIRGYDPEGKEFITNDPGTRRGEGFSYKEDVLDAALRDYPTGYKEQIGEAQKAMIVVEMP